MKACFLITAFIFLPVYLYSQEIVQEIEVEPKDETRRVKELIPLEIGSSFERRLLRITESFLEESQYYEQVSLTWDQENQILKIEVVPRRFFDEVVWLKDEPGNRTQIERLCIRREEHVYLSQERLSQIHRCILTQTQGKGYLDAHIVVQPEDRKLLIEAELGEAYIIEELELAGVESIWLENLKSRLNNQEGKAFRSLQLSRDTEILLMNYLKRGYLFTEVFDPRVDINTEEKTVSLSWQIDESPRVKVHFQGDYRSRKPLRRLVERGETLPDWFVEEIKEDIRRELRQRGYMEAQVEETIVERGGGNRAIKLRTDQGPQYRLQSPQWIGLNDPSQIQKIYQKNRSLRAGRAFYEEEYRDHFQNLFFPALVSEGFLDVKVRALEFAIDPDSAQVQPIIYMNEGERYMIERSAFEGFAKNIRNLAEYEDLERAARADKALNPLRLDELQSRLRQQMRDMGYLDAEIERSRERVGRGYELHFEANMGPRYRVENILIRGNHRTAHEVIEREVWIEPGDHYSQEAIQDSIAQILRLGVAQSVDIRILEKNSELGLVYLIVEIIEAPRFRFEFGPGYGTIDGVRGLFNASYSNIGGTGRRLSLFVRASRKLGNATLPDFEVLGDIEKTPFIERRATVEYFEPSLLTTPFDARASLTHRKESRGDLGVLTNSFVTALDYRFSRKWTLTTDYTIEFSNPFNVEVAEHIDPQDAEGKRLHSLGNTLFATYLDDEFNPTEGWRSRLRGEVYDRRLGSRSDFWRATTKQDFFLPLLRYRDRRTMGFALSVNVGFSSGYGTTNEVPVEKRFRVGGENTVRGYAQDSIQPIDSDTGELIQNGGRSRFFFRSELNIPVFADIDLLGFFDGGNIYRTNLQFNPFDLRFGAGGGIRMNTPVGPLKLGYAFILQRQEGEGRGQIFFGVGSL